MSFYVSKEKGANKGNDDRCEGDNMCERVNIILVCKRKGGGVNYLRTSEREARSCFRCTDRRNRRLL